MSSELYIEEKEYAALRTAIAFMDGRLNEVGAIDWALRLQVSDRVKRRAVFELTGNRHGFIQAEPWATAWRLIEESWNDGHADDSSASTAIYEIGRRISDGDRSGAIIDSIVNLVKPRLSVEAISDPPVALRRKRKPKTFEHLLRARLNSGALVDLTVLKLENIHEVVFLNALARRLEAAVDHGLDIARRLGWSDARRMWELGGLNRVYYQTRGPVHGPNAEPDAYHHGIAPASKLLYEVVIRIGQQDSNLAASIVEGWRMRQTSVYSRLWAAIARDRSLVEITSLGQFLTKATDHLFWDADKYPEIAEVRAKRFQDLDSESRLAIAKRLRKGPPRSIWSKRRSPEEVARMQRYWAARELKRVELFDGDLPASIKKWLLEQLRAFPELGEIGADVGYPQAVTVDWLKPRPDSSFDDLRGDLRLQALETAFESTRGGWDNDPAERANDWLRLAGNSLLVLSDLENSQQPNEYPKVWERFGWANTASFTIREGRDLNAAAADQSTRSQAKQDIVDRVLALLAKLSPQTINAAIQGLTYWLNSWNDYVVSSPTWPDVWDILWPFAVAETNRASKPSDEDDLNQTAWSDDNDRDPMDADTLNTPVGRLVGVLLSACPQYERGDIDIISQRTFSALQTVVNAERRSGLIARYRLIEAFDYFLGAIPDWTITTLVPPLLDGTPASLPLWRAFARGIRSPQALSLVSDSIVERATDRRLGRDTRHSLALNIIASFLWALVEDRIPPITALRIQQMLRTLDDEDRANAANTLQLFVRDYAAKDSKQDKAGERRANSKNAALAFRKAVAPFLSTVWPQEKSLVTPGMSKALADIPATSGDAFAEAVDSIERFLVPFDAWSMIDYGLYGADGKIKRLSSVNSGPKALALLRLLDLTIGRQEGAVVPHDLTDALDQIAAASPELTKDPKYRRLSTAARR